MFINGLESNYMHLNFILFKKIDFWNFIRLDSVINLNRDSTSKYAMKNSKFNTFLAALLLMVMTNVCNGGDSKSDERKSTQATHEHPSNKIETAQKNFNNFSGFDLYQECSIDTYLAISSADYIKIAHCIGYIQGVEDGQLAMFLNYPKSKLFCMPYSDVTMLEERMVVVKWIKNNPDEVNKKPIDIITDAFVNAYPCKNKI